MQLNADQQKAFDRLLEFYADPTETFLVIVGPGGTGNTLTNGIPVTGLAGSQNSELHFTIDLPANATNLSVALSGGSGDADPRPMCSYCCGPFGAFEYTACGSSCGALSG